MRTDSAAPSCSIVLVSYGTADLLVRAVDAALGTGAETVVVDNASIDDSVDRLKRLGARDLVLLENGTNVGFGTAANQGARHARGRSLVFLNSDARLDSSALGALLAELERWGGRAITAPRLVEPGGAVQHSIGLLPAPFDLALRGMGLHAIGRALAHTPVVARWFRRRGLSREYFSAATATETSDTTMASGACIAIGRDAFSELGGFDERFFMYFEDADLCRRAAAAGMPIRYVPAAVVSHVGGASSSEDYHFGPFHARSMRQYLGKWYGSGGSALALALLWLRAIGFSLALRPGTKRAWRALWAAVRDEDPRG